MVWGQGEGLMERGRAGKEGGAAGAPGGEKKLCGAASGS